MPYHRSQAHINPTLRLRCNYVCMWQRMFCHADGVWHNGRRGRPHATRRGVCLPPSEDRGKSCQASKCRRRRSRQWGTSLAGKINNTWTIKRILQVFNERGFQERVVLSSHVQKHPMREIISASRGGWGEGMRRHSSCSCGAVVCLLSKRKFSQERENLNLSIVA